MVTEIKYITRRSDRSNSNVCSTFPWN